MVDQPTPQDTEPALSVAPTAEAGAATLEKVVRPHSDRTRFLEEDEYSDDEYDAMLQMYEETLSNIEEGQIVKARVLRVTENAVILDVGFKSEGAITKDEFKNPDDLKVDDVVEVFLENLED